MILSERHANEGYTAWPIMVITNEEALQKFRVWLDTTTFSGCTAASEYDFPVIAKNDKAVVIDCDVSTGRQDILDWWAEQEEIDRRTGHTPVEKKEYTEEEIANFIIRIARGILSNKTWRDGQQVVDGIPIKTWFTSNLNTRAVTISLPKGRSIDVFEVQGSKDHCSLLDGSRVGVVTITPFTSHVQW